jgi:hypothetical protein
MDAQPAQFRKRPVMKKLIVVSALLLQILAPTQGAAEPDPKIRLAVTPMMGMAGGLPGLGIDLGMGYGMAAWGIHYANGSEICLLMCDGEPEAETQTSFLAGVREEFTYGFISLKSGIAMVERQTRNTDIITDYGYGIRNYEGFGVPFQFDMSLSGRFIGLSLSVTVMADSDGGSGSIMAGIPVGLLRW